MDKRSKVLVITTVILLLVLIIKSNFYDSVGVLDGDAEKYKTYVLQSAPLKFEILDKTGLITYRTVKVKMDRVEGNTEIIYLNEDGIIGNEILSGEYSGKVRAYLFNFIPVSDINIKGGVVRDGN